MDTRAKIPPGEVERLARYMHGAFNAAARENPEFVSRRTHDLCEWGDLPGRLRQRYRAVARLLVEAGYEQIILLEPAE
jgi:hypothetical protein